MACGEIGTGQQFVSRVVAHIDCQAQTIGAYGFGALADPNSFVFVALSGLLTLFVALFALRLMFGDPLGSRDIVTDLLRIAIVLTLASSWPAWRTLGYDVVMKGPGELASAVGGSAGLPGAGSDLVSRLQAVDDDIVMLTIYGTGRGTIAAERSDAIGDTFRGVALADQEGLANGRIAFLAGVIGPLAIVRLSAGLLLALAPIMAGLLLFTGTRDVFFGWLRALGALTLGGLALTIVYGVEISILAPWLQDALALRAGELQTPSAPIELTVITFAFALTSFGILAVIAKIFFFSGTGWSRIAGLRQHPAMAAARNKQFSEGQVRNTREDTPSRAYMVAEAVAQSVRREQKNGSERTRIMERQHSGPEDKKSLTAGTALGFEPLGSSYRKSHHRHYYRTSAASTNRDSRG